MSVFTKYKKWLSACLLIASIFFSLIFAEVGLRVLEKFSSYRFNSMSDVLGESFFFSHWKEGDRLYPSPEFFDPMLGWHAYCYKGGGLNAQGWRSSFDYKEKKDRQRVILIGDSFTWGSNLSSEETISSQLQKLLGSKFEVMNFSAEGFGLDQMVVAAKELAPKYKPDYVLIAFIGDDLPRSCLDFAWGQALKPGFKVVGSQVEIKNYPVLSPSENAKRHQQFWQRQKDRIAAFAIRSRVLNLLASPILRIKKAYCMETLNAQILIDLKSTASKETKLLFAHLDGELPPKFTENLQSQGISLVSLSENEPALAKELGVVPGRSDTYHPDAARARVIAEMYRRQIAPAAITKK